MSQNSLANFSSKETEINGLKIFHLNLIKDDRGWFAEKYRHNELVKNGLPENFTPVQNNVSYNKDVGVTRGIHAEPWDKYITVVEGEVFAAYVDLRSGKGFGRVVTVHITPEVAVFLPKGCGNSFQTLKPNTYYSYLVNDYWTKEKYEQYTFLNLADKNLSIKWPIALDKAIMSDRDRIHPDIDKIKPMEI